MYTICYQNDTTTKKSVKMMIPVTSETEYRDLRNSPENLAVEEEVGKLYTNYHRQASEGADEQSLKELKEEIDRIEALGREVLFDVDVKGGLNLKKILGDKATSIFICPPSIEELRRRLEGRGDTSPEMIEKRLAKAEEELSYKPYFDRVVINDELTHAFEQLDAIIDENN